MDLGARYFELDGEVTIVICGLYGGIDRGLEGTKVPAVDHLQ